MQAWMYRFGVQTVFKSLTTSSIAAIEGSSDVLGFFGRQFNV